MQNENLQKTSLRNKYFSLPSNFQFNFNSRNYKVDGVIFLLSALVIPLFISIISTIFFDLKNDQSLTRSVFGALNMLSIAVGLIFLMSRNPTGFFKNGYFWFAFLSLGPNLVAIVVGFFTSFAKNEDKDVFIAFSGIAIQLITEIIMLVLVFFYDRRIFNIIKETFKSQKIPLLIVAVVGTGALVLFSTFIFANLIEKKLFKAEESNNQNLLIGILNGQYSASLKITYGILLFLLVIVAAPMCEEIAFRDSVFLNCSNQWLGFVTSSLLFGFIHYGGTGDYEHFLSYTVSGVILSSVFLYTKGNVTHPWVVHLINNIIAFIIMLVGVFG